MEHLYGKMVRLHLKGSQETICGVLVEYENEHVYIQAAIDNVYVVPQSNILYYQTSSISFRQEQEEREQEVNTKMIERGNLDTLFVYIDREMVATIPIPPTLNLSTYNDNIYKTAYGNPDVKSALTGKVQKSIEYYPGRLFITTDGQSVPAQKTQTQDSFTMSGVNSMTTSFLNPSDMVSRLQNITKGDKDDNQTKM